MEIAITQFSPGDNVFWKRGRGRNRRISVHKVESVHISIYPNSIFKTFVAFLHTALSFIRRAGTEEQYQKLSEIKEKEKESKTTVCVRYKISGIKKLVDESQLTLK